MSARKACGVWTATSVARSSVAVTTPSASTCLIVSATATAGMAPSAPARTAADDGVEEVPAGERSGGVVHDHDLGIVGHGGQAAAAPIRRGCRPPATTPSRSGAIGRHDQDDAGAGRRRLLDGPIGDAPAAEVGELLGAAEARARAGGDHDRPHRPRHASRR